MPHHFFFQHLALIITFLGVEKKSAGAPFFRYKNKKGGRVVAVGLPTRGQKIAAQGVLEKNDAFDFLSSFLFFDF